MSEPGLFPLRLQDDDLQWKIKLYYDVPSDKFLLTINDKPFHQMPTQSEVNPEGPQNILSGAIRLDDIVVHDGWVQFNDDTLGEWYSELDREPVIDIHIGLQS